METLSLEYIAGLIDADGSFSISLSDERYKGNALTVAWVVNFRQLDRGIQVIEAIKNTLKCGKIYKHVKNMMSWQTVGFDETLSVCKVLLPHLKIKKTACQKMIESMELWNGREYNKHTARNKHQLTRPKWVMEKVLDIALNLNKCRQTETAYNNKKERIQKLKDKINQFYG